MALQTSGAISLNDVGIELGKTSGSTISLNDADVRGLAGVASGAISLSNFYGKAAIEGPFYSVASAPRYFWGVTENYPSSGIDRLVFYWNNTKVVDATSYGYKNYTSFSSGGYVYYRGGNQLTSPPNYYYMISRKAA